MRILHVSDVTTGGLAATLAIVVREQLRAGHTLSVCLPSRPDFVPPELFVRWQVTRQAHRVRDGVRQLQRAYRLARPDVVHLHSFVAGALGRLAFGSARYGAALVYQPHSWNYRAATNPITWASVVAAEATLARRTDLVVTNCRDETAEGRRHGVRAPAVAVGLPLDLETFTPVSAEQRAAHRRRLHPSGRPVVLNVGDLCWQKGQDRLVQAWEQAPVPGAELVLVGDHQPRRLRPHHPGELAGRAPREWGTSIRSVGHHRDVRPWLWSADVVVLPSRYEAGCVTLGEALACGTPVVATAFNGAGEALTEGTEPPAGAVLDTSDMAAVLHACAERVGGSTHQVAEASAARVRSERLFATAAVMSRLESAYAQALGR